MLKQLQKKAIIPLAMAVLIAAGGSGILSYAHTSSADVTTTAATTTSYEGHGPEGDRINPGIMGTISAINGNTVTVESAAHEERNTSTTTTVAAATYTVDIANARLLKAPDASTTMQIEKPTETGTSTRPAPPQLQTLTSSDLKIGDTVRIRGTVSGTSVVATELVNGAFFGHRGGGHGFGGAHDGVMGTVESVSGTTLVVNGKQKGPDSTSTLQYTVDASAATINKNVSGTNSTLSISDVQAGDTVMIRGTITGTSIVAKEIHDGEPPHRPEGMMDGAMPPPAIQ